MTKRGCARIFDARYISTYIHPLAQVEATWASFGWPKSKAGWLLSDKLQFVASQNRQQ